ncbi:E3 ubiquitin-protein ligase TRIM33-like isoform X2 [Vespula maculifrons]|uniref:E3 ubiquitin-protein ligase TRIM33-like isoform X2 n=1 Tax=Vespula maculifrons TaxID=7453 RepID=A0ABD2CSS1_VESMC
MTSFLRAIFAKILLKIYKYFFLIMFYHRLDFYFHFIFLVLDKIHACVIHMCIHSENHYIKSFKSMLFTYYVHKYDIGLSKIIFTMYPFQDINFVI